MEGDAPQTPQFERDMTEDVLAKIMIQQAQMWATLHPGTSVEMQEARDHLAFKIAVILGADILR